jgi:4-hydroxy-tetrahydrodipicolinate synthase
MIKTNNETVKEIMFQGCYTALITPMLRNFKVDFEGLRALVDFQVSQGVSGILAMGTTGESPTLTWEEHTLVIEKVHEYNAEKLLTIAGTGSNCTRESYEGTKLAYDLGVKAVLLVDPYYSGPSSIEIRREYIAPIAERFADVNVIPYVIPGRTGTQLLPQDLAILHSQFSNVRTVKEATGDLQNMKLTRKLCGENFNILSGDDDKTVSMMTNSGIKASGVVSVVSNIAPAAVQKMTTFILEGRLGEAEKLSKPLELLFQSVTVKTTMETQFGEVSIKARNPLPYKSLMNILGMPSGPPRQPLGKMTKKGLHALLESTRKVYENNPELLKPIEDFFDVDLSQRLYNVKFWESLSYD